MHAKVNSNETEMVWYTPQHLQLHQQPKNVVESGFFGGNDFRAPKRKRPSDEMSEESSNISYDRKGLRFIIKQLKKILAIILIVLDVIFDWKEYTEMSSKGESSTSNKKETVSCTTRVDHLAEKFMIFTILGSLFAVVQIANLTFQIYMEMKHKRATKLMDGRTEVVISRLFEGIPQILLIIAFRAECNINCGKNIKKNVKAILSVSFSIVSSFWCHIISSPSSKKNCGEKCLRCCFPCCFWTCRCYPCGRILNCEFCMLKCKIWGCESGFLCCLMRCYPTHLDLPETNYFECCTRTNEVNCLTRLIMKFIMIAHVFVYVVFVLNMYCLINFMVYLDDAADTLF